MVIVCFLTSLILFCHVSFHFFTHFSKYLGTTFHYFNEAFMPAYFILALFPFSNNILHSMEIKERSSIKFYRSCLRGLCQAICQNPPFVSYPMRLPKTEVQQVSDRIMNFPLHTLFSLSISYAFGMFFV